MSRWRVYNEETGQLISRHNTEDTAVDKAEKLSLKNPEVTYNINSPDGGTSVLWNWYKFKFSQYQVT